jgi:hypothetical protein
MTGPVHPRIEGDPHTDSKAAQQWFEAQFNHTPRVDTRTPSDVAAQAIAEKWTRTR